MIDQQIIPELSLPPAEAIAFFRQKLRIPTARWLDLWQAEHDRGFMVAGAMRDDMLVDFQNAIEQAIAEGTTIEEFRDTFDEVVERTGWAYKGGRDWRTRIIFETNLRTSYAAGRSAQMRDPEVLAERPYWEYRHGDSLNPRPEHLAWDGLILPADDPWWDTHYPPNGWGCKCGVFSLSKDDLTREGLQVGRAPDMGHYSWQDPATGKTEQVPAGIDPGWAYHPGKSWYNPQTKKVEPMA